MTGHANNLAPTQNPQQSWIVRECLLWTEECLKEDPG